MNPLLPPTPRRRDDAAPCDRPGRSDSPVSGLPLKSVLLYDDQAAGHRAMAAWRRLVVGWDDGPAVQPDLHRFDLLEDPAWYAATARAAVAADLVIVSSGAPGVWPATVNRWTTECLAAKAGAPSLLLALFGEEGAWMISIRDAVNSPAVRQVGRLVTQSDARGDRRA